ncbi:SUMF1/EgtB/PvdO family nonheme iron enzyme [Candidatus Electrothrix sp.]|uniref:SUMF1/EgtB/PvdO family nonheme iron enzyme n=1 Tax=Candidatus Electrothrix sp. TaxID=2170559 RepID=UPI004055C9FB
MIRGGSWNNNARNARSANRNRNTPGNRNNNLGFRLVLPPAHRILQMQRPLTRTKSCPDFSGKQQ